MKKSRARSDQAKEKQFQRIIREGEKLFLKYGSQGANMRKLAQNLNMGSASASSIYTYVSSKRELWFAIIRQYFEEFEQRMLEVIPEKPKSTKNVLIDVAMCYYNFALEDLNRYRMMFQVPPPYANKIGPIEASYQSQSIYFLKNLVESGIKKGEFHETDVDKLTFFLWGLLHGPLTVIETELFGERSQLPRIDSKKAYIAFLIQLIKRIVEIL